MLHTLHYLNQRQSTKEDQQRNMESKDQKEEFQSLKRLQLLREHLSLKEWVSELQTLYNLFKSFKTNKKTFKREHLSLLE